MNKLTKQEKTFISEYIKTLDAENAAKIAGFKAKNLKLFATELLSRESIINAINNELKHHISYLRVQKGYVIQKLLQIAEFSLQEEDILDKEGYPTGKRKLRDTSSALKALEGLCKYLGLNNNENENGLQTKIITICNLDDKKI